MSRHSWLRHIAAALSALALVGGVAAFGGERAGAEGPNDCLRDGVVRMRERGDGHWGCNASYPHFDAASVGLHDEWLVVIQEDETGDTNSLIFDYQFTIYGTDVWRTVEASGDAWTAIVAESSESDRDWLVLIEQRGRP